MRFPAPESRRERGHGTSWRARQAGGDLPYGRPRKGRLAAEKALCAVD